VIKASLLASVFGFISMTLAANLFWVLITSGFFVLSNSMFRPGVTSLTSKKADIGQGAAMGLSNSYMSLGRILGPLWAGNVLDIDLHYPFITGAVIMLIAFIASLFFLPAEKKDLPALDAESGGERWKFETGGEVATSPAVAGDTVYFGSNDTYFYALDTGSGVERWKFKVGDTITSSPAVAGGVIYFGSDDGYLYALQ
jgi:outer membrane protein assembly factor BamB